MGANLIGQQLEHYRIEGIIGEGGMGTVYRGEDVNLARPVAIKVMHSHYAMQEEFQKRFQQEAQAAARLEHPSIVRVYHFGREQGYLYIVMELVPGLSLGTYLKQLTAREQIIRLDETILLIAQVADALGYAHHKGVIHRDVKPDNILVKQLDQAERPDEPPLRAVVTDFGLAKLMEGGIETQPGEFMGTLAYISPEQILEKPLDGRSDIYSLGIVLFQLATGQLPFRVRTPSEAILKHIQQAPPVPHDMKPGLPLALEQIILKALAKKPEDRYQTGEAFATSLRQAAIALSSEENNDLLSETQSSVTSMVVELDSDPNLANTNRWQGEKRVRPPVYDRLLIDREGEEAEMYSLYKSEFTIGRSESNDIVLVGNNVSRWHARLSFSTGQWHITDSGSTNGTFLNGVKLIRDNSQIWSENQVVRIGPFRLRLEIPIEDSAGAVDALVEPAHSEFVESVETTAEPVLEDPQSAQHMAAVPPARMAGEFITADMRPRQLKKSGICRVLLLNKGDRRSVVTVSCNDPSARIRFDSITKQVTLSPGQKGIVDFYLEANKQPFSGRKKAVPFNIHIATAHREWERLSGQLTVNPQIPIWLILLFLIFFLLILAALVYGIRFLPLLTP